MDSREFGIRLRLRTVTSDGRTTSRAPVTPQEVEAHESAIRDVFTLHEENARGKKRTSLALACVGVGSALLGGRLPVVGPILAVAGWVAAGVGVLKFRGHREDALEARAAGTRKLSQARSLAYSGDPALFRQLTLDYQAELAHLRGDLVKPAAAEAELTSG